MIGVIYIIKKTVYYLIRVILIMMFARALSSWLTTDEDSKLNSFLYAVTEPFVIPVRMLVDKIEALRNLPMDISFMLAFMILGFVQVLLSFANV
ncbi:MAG TPA: YggT family protein [Clostridiales bacterium]|jgi:YggT family protein|nr:YggT family protein [Clostridiales bacterium]